MPLSQTFVCGHRVCIDVIIVAFDLDNQEFSAVLFFDFLANFTIINLLTTLSQLA